MVQRPFFCALVVFFKGGMLMKTIPRLLVLLLSTLFCSATSGATYTITDLGTLGGNSSQAYGVNIHGQVVGSAITATGAEHAFLYRNGVMTDLGVLNHGDTFSRAYGINDSGVVVGQSLGATSDPFIYADGHMSFVGSLGGNYGSADAINNAGQIVGISADANGVTHAFRSTGGTMLDLGVLSAAQNYSTAHGINSAGDVTGYSQTDAVNYDAFLYRAGSLQDLGNAYANSRGFSINDAGYIAGDSIINAAGDQHAFVWHNGVMTDLGTAGAASSVGGAINNLNEVVGTLIYDPSDGTKNSGFLYSNGVMVDVNTLLPANSGWVLRDAQDVNDIGQIVGFGVIDGQQHAYLLSPVPEPDSWILLGCGVLLLAFYRGRTGYSPATPPAA